MVMIRLFRTGATKRPMYRIVAIDSHRKRQGRVLQQLGTYNPSAGGEFHCDRAALETWVSKGAQLSDTVRSLLRNQPPAAAEAAEDAAEGTPAAG